jgi:hypothetical protein
LIFAYGGHLQALKVRDLKLLCLSQLCGLIKKNQSQILVSFRGSFTIQETTLIM